MMDKFGNRRRIYFIKSKFQMNFIIKFCVLVVIGSIISGAIIYLMSRATVTTSFENSRLTIKSTADYILPAVLLSSAVVIILVGLAAVAITMFTSHRIAGPLYRVAEDVREVAAGNLKKRFSVRRTDEIKTLAENLDKMTESLRTNIAEVKRCVSDLESGLQARSASKELQEKLESLKAALARFNA